MSVIHQTKYFSQALEKVSTNLQNCNTTECNWNVFQLFYKTEPKSEYTVAVAVLKRFLEPDNPKSSDNE